MVHVINNTEELLEMSEWQSIETAPKDGTVIWVCDARYGYSQVGVSKWHTNYEVFICLDDEGAHWAHPTHWCEMSYPEPPK